MEMEEMDLLEYWRILLKRKWLILILFVITVVVAGVFSLMMEPVYEATATLMVRDQGSAALQLFDPLAGSLGRNVVQNYVQILRSRTLLTEVAKEMGMQKSGSEFSLGSITSRLTVQPVQGTEVLRLSMQSTDPTEAVNFVNTLGDVFIKWNRSSNQQEMRSARAFIEEQLQVISGELRIAEENLRSYRENERVLSPSEETKAALEQYAAYERSLAETRVARIEIQQRMEQIQQELADQEETLISSTTIGNNPLLSQYKSRLADLEISLSGARERYTQRHPTVLGLQAEIEDVRSKITAEVERVISTETRTLNPIHRELYGNMISLQVELMALESRERALSTLRDQSEGMFSTLPQKELELARLMRDTKVLEEIYLMLMQRNEEFRISEAMQVADVQIIDPAVMPRSPIKPRIRLNLAIAGVLGLFLGTGLAFVLEYIDTSIKSKEEAESILELPVLGQIPHFEAEVGAKKGKFSLTR